MGFKVFCVWRSWVQDFSQVGKSMSCPHGWDAGMLSWAGQGCSCSLYCSDSLWDLGILISPGRPRVAQLCPAWEKEMENLCMEQEGKAEAAGEKLGLAGFSSLAEEGGKSQHLDKKKKGGKSKLQLFLLLLPWAGVPTLLCWARGSAGQGSKGSCWSPTQAAGEQSSPAAGINPGSPKYLGWQRWVCQGGSLCGTEL